MDLGAKTMDLGYGNYGFRVWNYGFRVWNYGFSQNYTYSQLLEWTSKNQKWTGRGQVKVSYLSTY